MTELTSLNTLPPRATLVPFPAEQVALALDRERSPWFVDLSGEWQFKIRSTPEEATFGELDADPWSRIAVPGNWTMQGFGKPQYTNVAMPFPQAPPHDFAFRRMRRGAVCLCQSPARRDRQGRAHARRVRRDALGEIRRSQ